VSSIFYFYKKREMSKIMIHGNALEEQNAIENVFTGNRSTEKEYKTQNA